ncbi:hypothetical protein DFQ29_005180, partial [Apophysomyces sp. BC1021]
SLDYDEPALYEISSQPYLRGAKLHKKCNGTCYKKDDDTGKLPTQVAEIELTWN